MFNVSFVFSSTRLLLCDHRATTVFANFFALLLSYVWCIVFLIIIIIWFCLCSFAPITNNHWIASVVFFLLCISLRNHNQFFIPLHLLMRCCLYAFFRLLFVCFSPCLLLLLSKFGFWAFQDNALHHEYTIHTQTHSRSHFDIRNNC